MSLVSAKENCVNTGKSRTLLTRGTDQILELLALAHLIKGFANLVLGGIVWINLQCAV